MFENMCPPAIIYILFSLVQIIVDTTKGFYNTAFLKLWVAIIFTILLNYLCSMGLGVISWFIVFIPFILMTLIITMLLFSLGLNPTTGKINFPSNKPSVKQPQGPPDYRQLVTKKQAYYDNYNDANVNTVVTATGSKDSNGSTDNPNSIYNQISNDTTTVFDNAKNEASKAKDNISKYISNLENDL